MAHSLLGGYKAQLPPLGQQGSLFDLLSVCLQLDFGNAQQVILPFDVFDCFTNTTISSLYFFLFLIKLLLLKLEVLIFQFTHTAPLIVLVPAIPTAT